MENRRCFEDPEIVFYGNKNLRWSSMFIIMVSMFSRFFEDQRIFVWSSIARKHFVIFYV